MYATFTAQNHVTVEEMHVFDVFIECITDQPTDQLTDQPMDTVYNSDTRMHLTKPRRATRCVICVILNEA